MTIRGHLETQLPTDAKTGLILPLSKSLGSQAFKEHKAMVALELEVLAQKYGVFGWENNRGTAAQDRLVTDWINVLADYLDSNIKCNG